MHEELRFKATLPAHCQKVLDSKSVLLWRKLLEVTAFPDKGVFELMCGTPLAGEHSKSEIFGEKVVIARTSEDLLRLSSIWRNPTLLARKAHDDDPALQKLLWEETSKEVEKGYIQGPYEDLEKVKKELGSQTVCLVRRFAILQGQGKATTFEGVFNLLGAQLDLRCLHLLWGALDLRVTKLYL